MNLEDLNFAYITTALLSQNTFAGAILVTDYKGFPLEFKYTDPVVPTKIQQVLYGSELENYIKLDVICDNLVSEISVEVLAICVQDEYLLNYKTDIPVIRLSQTNTSALEDQKYNKIKDNEYLIQTSALTSPIRMQLAEHYSIDNIDKLISPILQSGSYVDICEPFNRISKTLELVVAQNA